MSNKSIIISSFIVASLTVALDYFFHLYFTSPMEVPYYFEAKFLGAFAVAYILLPRWKGVAGRLGAALVFTIGFDAYYGIGILVLHLNYLSSSPTQIISILGIMDPITLFILWTLLHGAFFFAGASAVGYGIDGE